MCLKRTEREVRAGERPFGLATPPGATTWTVGVAVESVTISIALTLRRSIASTVTSVFGGMSGRALSRTVVTLRSWRSHVGAGDATAHSPSTVPADMVTR